MVGGAVAVDAWVEVKCTSVACLAACPGGRVLFRQKGPFFSFKRRGQGAIGLTPLVAICRCGWIWKNTELASMLDATDALGELGA